MADQRENFSQFGVTLELFNKWRAPRFGDRNPTVMNNPVWEWLIHTKSTGFQAAEEIGAASSFDAGPTWCFDRFGQSCTKLPSGRKIYIAGEHEDHYDPDFNIYNDVVVEESDGSITIYGFPDQDFPPTDFHTATLVNSEIFLIGNLGYADDRKPGWTQVLTLNTESFVVNELVTSGEMPGWIHDHQAVLSDDQETIFVTGGKVDRASDQFLIENIDDWRLNLKDGTWECVLRRHWPRWQITRSDGEMNNLWEIRQLLWSATHNWEDEDTKALSELEDKLGTAPNLESVENLYRPDLPHDVLPYDIEEFNVYRITVAGVVVRFVEDWGCVLLTIEGELPDSTQLNILESTRKKLSALENSDYVAKKIP